jgi:hypothetical protein
VAVAIVDAGETGDSIANIIVATGHVIDRVPAATCGAPFQTDELIDQLGIVQQVDATRVNQWQERLIKI